MTPLKLVITGAPRTKKTSNRLVVAGGRHVVLPSAAWVQWSRTAQIQFPPLRTLTHALTCAAQFYRDADRGDLVGYMQGLADLLEKRHVLANDKQIRSWDGTRLHVDRGWPRVELVLSDYLEAAA